MKRYFFNTSHDGEFVADLEGEKLPTTRDAKITAVEAVREIVAARIRRGLPIPDDFMEVRDDADMQITTVPYRAVILELFVP